MYASSSLIRSNYQHYHRNSPIPQGSFPITKHAVHDIYTDIMRRKQFEGMGSRVNLTTMASKSSSTIDGPYGSVMGCTSTSNAGFTNCTSMKKNESISLFFLVVHLLKQNENTGKPWHLYYNSEDLMAR